MRVTKGIMKSSFLVLALILAVFLTACGNNNPEGNPTAIPISDFAVPIYFEGRVIPRETFELSFARPGIVETLTVQVGDVVNKGDTLAILDTQSILNEIQIAEARLSIATANLELARQSFTNPNSRELAVTQAQLDEAQLNLDIAKLQLEETNLTAPIDGTVTDISTHQYEYAFAGQTVVQIRDLHNLSVELQIDIFDLGETQVGDSATVYFENLPDVELEGVVRNILPNEEIDRGGRYYVIIDLTETADGVEWGLPANVLFEN